MEILIKSPCDVCFRARHVQINDGATTECRATSDHPCQNVLKNEVKQNRHLCITRLRCVIYEFFACSTKIPRGFSAYKPYEVVVYCLTLQ